MKKKQLRILFVCGEFDNNSERYLFIHLFIYYLFIGQHFNSQIIHTIQLVSSDTFNNYRDNVL